MIHAAVGIVDAGALGARTPAELSIYLRSRGWRLAGKDGASAIWTLPFEDDEFEIRQPLDPTLRDYAARVRDAVEVLASAEGRSELEILQGLSDTSMDVHTVRLFPPDQPPGMIGIDDGLLALESLRGLVSAAAYPVFATEPRPVQPARKPQGLADFLRTVRIGPGSEGSYVLSVHTPIPPRLSAEQPSIFDEPGTEPVEAVPVERQISVRIYQSVLAAREAADAALLTADGLAPFTQGLDQGVSANLCEALAGLGGAGRHPFELAMVLAASRPAPDIARMDLSPIRFRQDHLHVLQQAATELRARTPEDDVRVTGHVIRLHRETGTSGEITIVGQVDEAETLRRVWVRLDDQRYDQAMRAHEAYRQVSVRGNLVRRGTRHYLVQPTGFHVLGEELR